MAALNPYLYWTSGALLGAGLMLGSLASIWPVECTVRLTDGVGVVHEYVTECG